MIRVIKRKKAIEISELLNNGDVMLLQQTIKQLKDIVIEKGLARSSTQNESLKDQKSVEKHQDQCLDLIVSFKKSLEKKSTDRFYHSNEYSSTTMTLHLTSNSFIVLSDNILKVQLISSSIYRSDDYPKCFSNPLTSPSIIKPHETTTTSIHIFFIILCK